MRSGSMTRRHTRFRGARRAWTRSSSNPVLGAGASGGWDPNVMHAGVIFEDNVYKMWYSGGEDQWNTQIGYAEAYAMKEYYVPLVMRH